MLVTTLKKESLKQNIQSSNDLTMKTPDFQHDPDMMIRINDVNFFYGETQALKSINMNLPEKKITSLCVFDKKNRDVHFLPRRVSPLENQSDSKYQHG